MLIYNVSFIFLEGKMHTNVESFQSNIQTYPDIATTNVQQFILECKKQVFKQIWSCHANDNDMMAPFRVCLVNVRDCIFKNRKICPTFSKSFPYQITQVSVSAFSYHL